MLDRLLLTAGLILLGLLAYQLLKRYQLRRRRSQALGIPGYRPGQATILYFTTPTCAPCRTVQKPALAAIKDQYGSSVNILQFDASRHTGLADSWGVLSVPTTFIIDRQGRPRGVNHGVARAGKLKSQLGDIGVEPNPDWHSRQAQLAHSREN